MEVKKLNIVVVFILIYFIHGFKSLEDLWNMNELTPFVSNNFREIFGDGEQFSDIDNENNFLTDPSHSTEDLMLLLQAEKEFLNEMLSHLPKSKNQTKLNKMVKHYLSHIDYDLNEESNEYVYHPINTLQLLKRISKLLSKFSKITPSIKSDFQSLLDDQIRAYHGIADIHEFYGIELSELAEGKIKNYITGKIYQSKSQLNSRDLLEIAKEAKKVKYLDGYVEWLNIALKKAKKEKRDKDYINTIKIALKNGKLYHDTALLSMNLTDKIHIGFTKDEPYFPVKKNSKSLDFLEKRAKLYHTFNSNFTNFIPDGQNWDQADISLEMDVLYRNRTQELCKGTFHRNPYYIQKGLKCVFLHHNHPYLRLGPFKFEMLHQNPEIAILHQFASSVEVEKIKNLARGRMKSTPFVSQDAVHKSSKKRTSKVMYMNEKLVPAAMVISKKIERATKFTLYNEQFASENYQVMNYGTGGKITPHIDSHSIYGKDVPGSYSSEAVFLGGPRFVTFMIFMTSVEAGGHTVFPQPGISVQPEQGSALYWFNMGSQNNLDSRIRHLGCPVLYGNKWIANKWIKWFSNFKKYPCLINQKNYSVLEHHF